jgi:hypothetical protein
LQDSWIAYFLSGIISLGIEAIACQSVMRCQSARSGVDEVYLFRRNDWGLLLWLNVPISEVDSFLFPSGLSSVLSL